MKRDSKNYSNDASEVSDGYKTPDESVTSDILGGADYNREDEDSVSERLGRGSYLSSGRRSVNKDPYDDKSNRYTSARPVARRSVSRELFDLKYNTGRISPSPYHSSIPDNDPISPSSRRMSRISREGSSGRDDASLDQGLTSPGSYSRSISLSRGGGGLLHDQMSSSSRPYQPSRPVLSSGGRSGTQNEIMRNSPLLRYEEDGGSGLGGGLRDRKRDDWRRISVPERGKDFNSLPRKYTRQGKNSYI